MSCESSITDLTMMGGGGGDDDCREQLLSHIRELHEAVVEMKGAFTTAQLALAKVSVDENVVTDLRLEVEGNRNGCVQRGSDILQVVMGLKGEVAWVKESLQAAQIHQHGLQATLHALLEERDVLLEELGKSGAISEHARIRLHSSRLNGGGGLSSSCPFPPLPRPSSGSHSHESSNNDNDSGVALLLLEKVGAAFNQGGSANANVQEYLNTLEQERGSGSSGREIAPEDLGGVGGGGIVYDSDCSLTLAATRSLSLSNSLSKQCGLELDQDGGQLAQQLIEVNGKGGGETGGRRGSGVSEISEGNLSSKHAFKEGQRLKVAKELVETEGKYCHTLHTIQETFAQPLKNLSILSIKDINTLFPEEVFSLYEKHTVLLCQLEERIALWKVQPMIGDIIERFTNIKGSDVLRLYTNYVNDFPEVLKTFHKLCRTSREFTQFLKSSLEHPSCGGLDLGAFLLSPVQRMPRYILLLKQILKYTEANHPDYNDITTCLDRLRDYLKRLNDSMEHSFQLVTAQIDHVDHHDQEGEEKNKKIGFSNALGFGFGGGMKGNREARGSVCSSQSSTGEDIGGSRNHKARYNRRSTSVPRNQGHHLVQLGDPDGPSNSSADSGDQQGCKLRSRSKSDWTVCQMCNCEGSQGDPRHGTHDGGLRGGSDSDINSDMEELSPFISGKDDEDGGNKAKFSTSKSLHDFHRTDWFLRSRGDLNNPDNQEQEVPKSSHLGINQSHHQTVTRNNIMIIPPGSSGGGRYVARIQRGSESEMNLTMIGLKKETTMSTQPSLDTQKKKGSLRTSLKNLFSLKKRSTRTLQISGPILPSKSYPSLPPPPVATLRYHPEGKECYQSLPPEPVHPPPCLSSLSSRRSSRSPSQGPVSLPPHPPHPHRYARNPAAAVVGMNKWGHPNLPKTPFMTKYQQQLRRSSPYTDV